MRTPILSILCFFFLNILFAQDKDKDTLYFKIDGKYVFNSTVEPNNYLIKDSSGSEIIYFEGAQNIKVANPKSILNLKDYVRSSAYYNKNKFVKLDYHGLFKHLSDYNVVFVKKNNECILVKPQVVIYD